MADSFDIKKLRFGNDSSTTSSSSDNSLQSRFEVNSSIFGQTTKAYNDLYDKSIGQLDKASIYDAIKKDMEEANASVNKAAKAGKKAKALSMLGTGLNLLTGLSSMRSLNKFSATSSTSTTTTDYTQKSDPELSTLKAGNEKKISDAEKTISDQTVVKQNQQKIIDANVGNYGNIKGMKEGLTKLQNDVSALDLEKGNDPMVAEYKKLQNDVAALDLKNGSDPLVTEYKAIDEELGTIGDGTHQLCNDLKKAKETKIYTTDANGAKVEDTAAKQKAIQEAQNKVDAKKRELEAKKTAKAAEIEKEKTRRQGLVDDKAKAIDTEKTSRQKAVDDLDARISKVQSAITENEKAENAIKDATTEKTTAKTELDKIVAEQNRRASSKKK